MKIININATWCGSCIKMKKIWNDLQNKFDLNLIKYDIDFDEEEVKKYSIGDVLPVSIFLDDNNNELCRLIGEKTIDEIEEIIKKYR